MNTETLVYSASKATNKWTKEAVPIQWYLDKGAEVRPARLHGDYTLWINGKNVAALLVSQQDQIRYLKNNNMLELCNA